MTTSVKFQSTPSASVEWCPRRREADPRSTVARFYPSPLREESTLNLGEFHGCGALRVVVPHMIDPSAHGIATHQPCIEGLQQFGRGTHVPHPRIKPQVVGVWIEYDWHTVVNR